MSDYFNTLRNAVPARTMAVYTSASALYSLFAKPTDIPAWLIILICALALTVHIVVGIVTRRGALPLVLSAVAFLLMAFAQPFYGLTAALGLPNMVCLAVAAVTIAFLSIVPAIFKGQLAQDG
jgi:hypothetical protein